jgi:hypothetical protein
MTVAVVAGLVPAIHVFVLHRKGVDAQPKAGHDDFDVNLTGAIPA